MRVLLNGEDHDLPANTTVAELVVRLGLRKGRVAIELNRDILARDGYEARGLKEGDEIEIVQFVGGG